MAADVLLTSSPVSTEGGECFFTGVVSSGVVGGLDELLSLALLTLPDDALLLLLSDAPLFLPGKDKKKSN